MGDTREVATELADGHYLLLKEIHGNCMVLVRFKRYWIIQELKIKQFHVKMN